MRGILKKVELCGIIKLIRLDMSLSGQAIMLIFFKAALSTIRAECIG